MTALKKPWLYRIVHWLLTRIIRPLFLDLSIEGLENLPSPPYILSGNHFNWSDPVLVACITNHPLYFMGKAELFRNPLSSAFMRSLSAFPVKRQEMDRKAIAEAINILNKRGALVLFPEGTRSKTGELGFFLAGAAYLSLRTKVPIVPVGIKGAFGTGIVSFFLPKKNKFILKVGKPLMGMDTGAFKSDVEGLTYKLKAAIAELII